MAARTLQFFASQLIAALDEASVKAIQAGKTGAKMVIESPLSAIEPTDGNARAERSQFRGDAKAFLEMNAPREYQGYVVPKGTVLEWTEGARGGQIAGQSAFLSTDEEGLVDLGTGTSAVLAARFNVWKAENA